MKTTDPACGDHYAGDYYSSNSANEQQYAVDPSSTSYDNFAYVASSGNASEYGSVQENYIPTVRSCSSGPGTSFRLTMK